MFLYIFKELQILSHTHTLRQRDNRDIIYSKYKKQQNDDNDFHVYGSASQITAQIVCNLCARVFPPHSAVGLETQSDR